MKFKLSLFICLLIHYLLSHIKKSDPSGTLLNPTYTKLKRGVFCHLLRTTILASRTLASNLGGFFEVTSQRYVPEVANETLSSSTRWMLDCLICRERHGWSHSGLTWH